MGKTRAAV